MRLINDSPLLRSMALLNILFLVILLIPLYWPLPDSTKEITDASIADYETLIGFSLITDVTAAKERPIFHFNRRPPQAVQAPQKAVQKRVEKTLNIQLKGIVQAKDGQRIAYLQNTDTNETFSARVFDSTAGWTVEAIHADRVILVNGQRRKVLDLNQGG